MVLRPRLRRLVLGDAEIEQLQRPGGRHDDVRRRDVAVDDVQRFAVAATQAVHVVERAADLAGDVGRDGDGHRPPRVAQHPQQPTHRRPIDEFQDQEQRAVRLAEVVDLNDVRVVEHAEDLAPAMNMRRNSGSAQLAGRMRLTTTVRSKPPGPEQVALNASAMPPTPSDLISGSGLAVPSTGGRRRSQGGQGRHEEYRRATPRRSVMSTGFVR